VNHIGLAVLCGVLLSLCYSTNVFAKTLRIGLITPPSHIWTQAARNLAADIAKESAGRHKLIVYPSRQLGNEAQMLQLMQTGALDMAILTAAEVSNRVPQFGALYTPYLAKNIEQAAQVLRGDVAASLLELLPEQIGVFGLGYGMGGLRQILSTIPVNTLDDMRGRKLRITPFEPIKDFYNLAGVAPTPMPLASVYDALANGQIDMLDMDLELIIKLKYHELSDTLVLSNHMMFPAVAMISGRVWIRLPEADRQIIRNLTTKHMSWVIDQAVVEEAAWNLEVRNLDTGLKIQEVGPEFFGDTASEWEKIWASKSGVISALHAELADEND
jgi:TRAP-type C4-dicarboxylate transport system substrate-binding protein